MLTLKKFTKMRDDAMIIPISVACEQALLFGQAKRASRERASEGLRKAPRGSFRSPK